MSLSYLAWACPEAVDSKNIMRILDEAIDVKKNSRLLLTEYRIYFRILIISVLLDAASTMYFMAIIGPERELNMIVRNLSLTYGIVVGPVAGKSIQVLAVWGLTDNHAAVDRIYLRNHNSGELDGVPCKPPSPKFRVDCLDPDSLKGFSICIFRNFLKQIGMKTCSISPSYQA